MLAVLLRDSVMVAWKVLKDQQYTVTMHLSKSLSLRHFLENKRIDQKATRDSNVGEYVVPTTIIIIHYVNDL